MANIDSNLIAQPGFVVKNLGDGQTITTQLAPVGANNGGTYTQTGWRPIWFNPALTYLNLSGGIDTTPYNVTPSVSEIADAISAITATILPNDAKGERRFRVACFLDFVNENPVHVKKINLRADVATVLPQQIIIKTPNIYTGQMDRQVIDIASKKTAYQYQNDIITIDNVDIFLCRNSLVTFNGSYSVSDTYQTDMELYGCKPMFIDWIIDYYLSLERGLVQNVNLLNTADGVSTYAVETYENTQAQLNPTLIVGSDKVSQQGIDNSKYVATPATAVNYYQTKILPKR